MAHQPKTAPPTGPVQLPTAELMAEVRNLVGALGYRAVTSLTDKATSATARLGGGAVGAVKKGAGQVTGAAGAGATGALGGVKEVAKQATKGSVTGAVKGAADSAKTAVGNLLGGGKGAKVTNIVEEVDVGVPVNVAYDQWTEFAEFPDFMKNVEQVEQESDEKLRWKAKIGLSRRNWESTITEQVPNQRIVWRSTGDKGYVDGAVTFHELGPDLTRIIVVLEYHPQGFVERFGNLWHAQGRRARANLRHFQRHVLTHTILHPDEERGWRGEIRDSRVVSAADSGRRDTESSSRPAERGRPTSRREEREEAEEQPERPARRDRAVSPDVPKPVGRAPRRATTERGAERAPRGEATGGRPDRAARRREPDKGEE